MNSAKLIIAVVLSFYSFIPAFSQRDFNHADSLKQKLSVSKGLQKVQALYSLSQNQEISLNERLRYVREGLALAQAEEFRHEIVSGYRLLASTLIETSLLQADSAFFYVDRSFQLASEWNMTGAQAEAKMAKAKIAFSNKDPFGSLKLNEEAVQFAEQSGDSLVLAKSLSQLSGSYGSLSLDSAALDYCQQALRLVDPKKDEVLYASILNQIGHCFSNLSDSQTALSYYQRYSDIMERHKMYRERATCHLNMAALYRDMGQRDKALQLSGENLAFARKHNLPRVQASVLAFVGKEIAGPATYDSSIAMVRAANHIWDSLGFAGTEFYNFNVVSIGDFYVKSGRVKQGIQVLQDVYQAARQTKSIHSHQHSLRSLIETYTNLKDFKTANQYLHELIRIKDSLQSQVYLEDQARLEFRYALGKASRDKEMVARENDANKALLAQKNKTLAVVAATVLLLMIGIGIVVLLYRQKAAVARELAISNNTIAHQKEELEATLEKNSKMQRHLLSSEKMASLGQLTAGIAHEINNPLNFISGGVAALEDIHQDVIKKLKQPTPMGGDEILELENELKEVTTVIHNGVSRSASIVKNLRTFSSPIDEINESSSANVKDSVTSALTLINSKIRNSDIRVELDLHDAVARGNDALLQQVLVNLLDNAVYALESKTTGERSILVRTKQSNGIVQIVVADTGPGIPKEIQNRILEPFFTTKEVGKGTGLGLSISYGIIQKHGGMMSFTSEPGGGTEFVISLPAK